MNPRLKNKQKKKSPRRRSQRRVASCLKPLGLSSSKNAIDCSRLFFEFTVMFQASAWQFAGCDPQYYPPLHSVFEAQPQERAC